MTNRQSSSLGRCVPGSRHQTRKHARFGFPREARGIRPGFRPCLEILEDRLVLATPTVIDPTAAAVTPLTAVLGGNLTSDGGQVVIQRGVVYSLTNVNPNPTLGGPGVTVTSTPPEVPTGRFAVTVGRLAPNSQYSFKAFAINNSSPNETGYSAVATFSTSSGIVMPSSTVTPSSPTDYAQLNKVLFFQPTDGMTAKRPNGTPYLVPQIPTKQITLTNNLDRPVYPFMRDAAATVDPAAKAIGVYQGEYDPIDQLNEEYRGYIGYRLNNVNYLGLLPGMTITVNVPLVFWDGARMEIATDGTYLVNDAMVGADPAEPIPNPFQYYRYNPKNTVNPQEKETARVALPASLSGGPAGTTGMVMWYRQGLNNQGSPNNIPPEQAKAPAGDAPSQLIEWTMRDPVLATLNPNIDELHEHFGETHANINYDVSYVDNMALPVAMEAADVPIAVQTDPGLDPRNPNPGPRLPYGWVGAAQSEADFSKAITEFISNDTQVNGLGQYFGGKGWSQYYLPATRFPGGTPPLKIPSGQDVISDSPLARHTTNYDAPISNHFMLTSGGTENFSLVGAGGAYPDGTTTLRIVANTPALQQILKEQLLVGMDVTIAAESGAPTVPAGTKVLAIGPAANPGFHFTRYEFQPNAFDTVLEVQLSNPIAKGTKADYSFRFNRQTTDYVTTALVNLWYTWAQYYVDHMSAPAQVLNKAGQSLTTDNGKKTNQIKLTESATALGLVPGMLVTGSTIANSPPGQFDPKSGIFQLRADQTGSTTIESIDPKDPTIINLSQAVGTSQAGATYSFFKPSMTSPAVAGANQAQILTPFNPVAWDPNNPGDQPNAVPGVTDVLAFAQSVYQLVGLMSQIPSEDKFSPISAQIVHNIIGGNITKDPLNGDINHKTEVAFRDKLKSLLRGVNDFTVQADQLNQWYPAPSVAKAGQPFNVYNLDPFVWFVHKKMGLSGYGFSLDDDAADISGVFSTRLAVAIGGLNGVPNHVEWSLGAPYGPVSASATVLSSQEIGKLPPYSFFALQPYNANEKIPGANLSGPGVPASTYLYAYGNEGLFSYPYFLSNQPPPSQRPFPSPPTPGPLQIPPLVVNGSAPFTFLGPGSANGIQGTLPAGQTTSVAPYTNTLREVTVPSGSTLKITSLFGNLTSYTQQFDQTARISMVATPDSKNGAATPTFKPNAPFPSLDTVVDGILDAARVDIVNGFLAGTGTVQGSLSVYGPVSGYSNPIELKPVNGEPIDPSWNNKKNAILGSTGGALVIGKRGATPDISTPGKLTVTGDVSLFGASFRAFVAGADGQGSSYSWLAGAGKVDLGNSRLELFLTGYTPKPGDRLTIITAANGVTGKFAQGNSIQVNGFTFQITYNANNVQLSYQPTLTSDPDVDLVTTLYRSVLSREPDPAGLTSWVTTLDSGVPPTEVERRFEVSPESRGRQVDGLYATYFHRTADPDGRAHWIAALSAGLSETDAAQQFLTCPEYTLAHSDDVSFVLGLYADVLGRVPDTMGLSAWIDAAQGGLDRAAIADTFLHSLEASRAVVTGYYTEFFGRDPDAAGLDFWSAMLQKRRASREQVAQAFLASDEFFALASDGKL